MSIRANSMPKPYVLLYTPGASNSGISGISGMKIGHMGFGHIGHSRRSGKALGIHR
jgi:hypothetical protein